MAAATESAASRYEQGLSSAPSFELIYAQHFKFVWRCLRGLGVSEAHLDDTAQEVFLVVHRRLHEFRGEAGPRAWLYAIVRNLAANQRRSQRRQPTLLPPEPELASSEKGPHQHLSDRQAGAFVQAFVAQLDEPKRDVFVLAVLEELSIPDVAETLQIPLNTAYSRLRNARIEFQQALRRKVAAT